MAFSVKEGSSSARPVLGVLLHSTRAHANEADDGNESLEVGQKTTSVLIAAHNVRCQKTVTNTIREAAAFHIQQKGVDSQANTALASSAQTATRRPLGIVLEPVPPEDMQILAGHVEFLKQGAGVIAAAGLF